MRAPRPGTGAQQPVVERSGCTDRNLVSADRCARARVTPAGRRSGSNPLMSQWIIRNRILLFVIVNLVLDLCLAVMGPANGSALGRVLYASALFALCSAPLTLLKSFNGRHILLLIFMCFYFMDFGGLDVQSMLTGFPI